MSDTKEAFIFKHVAAEERPITLILLIQLRHTWATRTYRYM